MRGRFWKAVPTLTHGSGSRSLEPRDEPQPVYAACHERPARGLRSAASQR